MPSKCCVPLCKGNYQTGQKVSVFSFPKDEELKKKWIFSIKRANFVPTKNSRVCELHFKKTDFEDTVSAYDEKTGRWLTAPLSVRRLKKNVIPTIFRGYPSYLLNNSLSDKELLDETKVQSENSDYHKADLEDSSMDSLNPTAVEFIQELQECENFILPQTSTENRNDIFSQETDVPVISSSFTVTSGTTSDYSSHGSSSTANRGKRKRSDSFSPFDETTDILKEGSSAPGTKVDDDDDDILAFGNSIMVQMRKLPEEYVTELMADIQNLVTQKRLRFITDRKHIKQELS